MNPFSVSGVGLHTGSRVKVNISPGDSGTGVVFIRNKTTIPARSKYIFADSKRNTTLINKDVYVMTVEHLLAAFLFFDEPDVIIEVDGSELPALDGSSIKWFELLLSSGAKRGLRFIHPEIKVSAKCNNSFGRIVPLKDGQTPFVEIKIQFDKAPWINGKYTFSSTDSFTDIAPARTFALETEFENLKKEGLARGGTIENAVLISHSGPCHGFKMRFKDEPLRHKMLDTLGDLFLMGGFPFAETYLYQPGHHLLHRLVSLI